MITISYLELLLTIVTICVVGGSVYFFVLARRIDAALQEWRKLQREIEPLVPHLDRAVLETEETLRSTRRLVERAEGIGRELEQVGAEARRVAVPALEQVGTILGPLRNAAAFMVGLRAAIGTLVGADRRSSNPSNTSRDEESDDEQR